MLLLFAIDLNVSPTSAGMPGAELIAKLLSWLSQLALWGSLASILVGAAIYGLCKEGGHGYNATRGRSSMLSLLPDPRLDPCPSTDTTDP